MNIRNIKIKFKLISDVVYQIHRDSIILRFWLVPPFLFSILNEMYKYSFWIYKQNKTLYILTLQNRNFCLLKINSTSLLQKRKERGRIPTDAIHTVEQAQLGELSKQILDDNESPAYRYPFQVKLPWQNNVRHTCLWIYVCMYVCFLFCAVFFLETADVDTSI